MLKKCTRCGNEFEGFRLRKYCSEKCAKLLENESGRVRAKRIKYRYGITLEQYNKMLEEQDGKCAICGSSDTGRGPSKNFHIDHCHATGKVRGLLCHSCNTLIGWAKDDPLVLDRAIQYLKRNGSVV